MKRLFLLFLKEEGLKIRKMPSKIGVRELSINFNAFANERGKRRNHQHTGMWNVSRWVAQLIRVA